MLDFLFSPVANLFVGLLSGVVCTTLIAETYFKDKIYRERCKRLAAEEKTEVLRGKLDDAKSEVYLSRRRKTEKEYMDKMMAYRKEMNRKPMMTQIVTNEKGEFRGCVQKTVIN